VRITTRLTWIFYFLSHLLGFFSTFQAFKAITFLFVYDLLYEKHMFFAQCFTTEHESRSLRNLAGHAWFRAPVIALQVFWFFDSHIKNEMFIRE
jgi:hypothetical protein